MIRFENTFPLPNCLACKQGAVVCSHRHGIVNLVCPFLGDHKYHAGDMFTFNPDSQRHAIKLCHTECNNFVLVAREVFTDRLMDIDSMVHDYDGYAMVI